MSGLRDLDRPAFTIAMIMMMSAPTFAYSFTALCLGAALILVEVIEAGKMTK